MLLWMGLLLWYCCAYCVVHRTGTVWLNNNCETCALICRLQRLRREMYNNALVAGNVAVQDQHELKHCFTVKRGPQTPSMPTSWWYEYGSFAPNVDVNVLKHIWSCWHHALQQVAYVHTHLICVLCTATYSLTENQAQSQRRLVKWRWFAPFITKRKRSTRLDTISEDNGHNKYVQNCFVVDKAFFKM